MPNFHITERSYVAGLQNQHGDQCCPNLSRRYGLGTEECHRLLTGDRRVRGLRPWAEDKELITVLNHGEFLINGLRNRDLQKLLYSAEAESPAERRRRSAAISRRLRLLRQQGDPGQPAAEAETLLS